MGYRMYKLIIIYSSLADDSFGYGSRKADVAVYDSRLLQDNGVLNIVVGSFVLEDCRRVSASIQGRTDRVCGECTDLRECRHASSHARASRQTV